ncbi:MAG: hypothetical protein HY367_01055, partial [Candidatus Aenigmarchaeota archaeon]|nr:hypothetical protein [Candidatus Aenigmarchaeota archaeon]
WNNVNLILFQPAAGDKTRLNPGGGVEVTYSTDFVKLVVNNTFNRTQYFDHIKSPGKNNNERGGVFAVMPVFVPQDSDVSTVMLHLNWRNVVDDPARPDVQVFFNDNRIYLNTSPVANSLVTINLTGNVSQSKGKTNTVTVFINVNTSLNEVWGTDSKSTPATIFSDPQNAPANSSRIYVEYVRPAANVKFGFIDINQVQHFTGPKANPKNVTVFFNDTPVDRSFLHVVKLDIKNVSVKVQPQGQAQAQVFQTPINFSLPSSVYIDPADYDIKVNNTITTQDTCTVTCEIINLSTVEYATLIKSVVGFGNVFPNATAAVDDAIERLKDVLGFYITATEIEVLNSSVKNVPSLWGPAKLEVRVWS